MGEAEVSPKWTLADCVLTSAVLDFEGFVRRPPSRLNSTVNSSPVVAMICSRTSPVVISCAVFSASEIAENPRNKKKQFKAEIVLIRVSFIRLAKRIGLPVPSLDVPDATLVLEIDRLTSKVSG